MFDALSDKLQATLGDVRQRGALTEDDVKATMREIRLALLEADVNFAVVREFTSAVREKALGEEVLKRVDPGQQVVKIVSDELTELMGGAGADLALSPRKPTIVVLAGLQGSGKTTAAAKLARMLREEKGLDVALAACDVYRPAAVEQLVTVGQRAGATVYERGTDMDPVDIAKWARDQAVADGRDVLIVDTSGRLHVDSELMQELANIKKELKPHDVLLVVDAMTGQDAVNVAEQFAEQVGFDGVIMSKLDGDARGGAALSVKAVTGMPILYASTGEKLDAFERFHPDRMAQRILGMGDVLTFVEKAQREVDQDQAAEMERKLRKAEFSFDDFLDQLQTVRRMGPIGNLIGMLPGAGAQLRGMKVDERELDRVEAIVLSMTPEERRRPDLIKGSRRLRIAKGSGTTVQAVNQLVKQFEQMRKLMKSMSRGKMPDIGALMRQAVRRRRRAACSSGFAVPSTASPGPWQPRRAGRLGALPSVAAMSVRIRLTRIGGRKDPVWRVVVADQRSPRDGRVIETIGHYNAQTEPSSVDVDLDRARAWLARGAQPTSQVRHLLRIAEKQAAAAPAPEEVSAS